MYKRHFEENKLKEEQIDEMLAVVYNYAEVMEKWENIKFVSEKESKEMKNKMSEASNIVRRRRMENTRKMEERLSTRNALNRIIDEFDDSVIMDHKKDLEEDGKLKKLEKKAS